MSLGAQFEFSADDPSVGACLNDPNNIGPQDLLTEEHVPWEKT